MTAVFLKIFNMSMTSVLPIVAVILLRILFKKAPKWITCVLWAIVAIRLIVPITLESPFSVLPTAEPVKTSAQTSSPYMESGVELIDSVANKIIVSPQYHVTEEPSPASKGNFADRGENTVKTLSLIWIAGIAGFLIYGTVCYLRLRRTVSVSVKESRNVWICDEIDSPFIFGIIRPRIYLPSRLNLNGKMKEYVLKHEYAHLKRHDHWWKPLGFVILAVHWFNPLCWIAYILFGWDVELATDEKAITDMEKEDKVGYSKTLLSLSSPGNLINACPVAFAEIGVKKRVKNIIRYKKPAFALIATGVVCCCTLSGCFLTNPSDKIVENMDSDVIMIQHDESDESSEPATETEEIKADGSEIAEETEQAEIDQTESAQTVTELGTPAFQGDINGNGTDDFIYYTGNFETEDESGNVIWFLVIDDKVVYEDKMDMFTDFTVWNHDVDNDGSEELIIEMDPHVNSAPLTTYKILKQNGSSWTALQNSDEFGMKDDNGDPNNSFPIRVVLGNDLKTGEISIDGYDSKITFDLEEKYRKLAEIEEGNDIGAFAQKFLDRKLEAGYDIGKTADWGIWDIKPAKLDGQNCLIARQGLCGKETGKFDMYGTLDIYFDYDASGKIHIIKTVFNENDTNNNIEDENIIGE
jgi:beta-lactamase regulating signal transducer with metallopeptidase domain